MKNKKIVISGGPGTGKTSLVKSLEKEGHICLHEVSRQIIVEAQKKGIEQLFLEDPLLFSKLLLQGRIAQYEEAEKVASEVVFIDRGIPDVVAYMNYFGNKYPALFTQACSQYRYDTVFLLPPWKEIYTSDSERYENFEQATAIHVHLEKCYKNSGYTPIEVPVGTVSERTSFILSRIQ